MTNKEKLIGEIICMDDKRLGDLLDRVDVDGAYPTDIMCDDCKARNGGRCPYDPGDGNIPDDCDCPTMADWLGWECARDRIIEGRQTA